MLKVSEWHNVFLVSMLLTVTVICFGVPISMVLQYTLSQLFLSTHFNANGYTSELFHQGVDYGPAMVLANFQNQGVQLIWIIVGQKPTVLTVGAEGAYSGIFFSSKINLIFCPLSGRQLNID